MSELVFRDRAEDVKLPLVNQSALIQAAEYAARPVASCENQRSPTTPSSTAGNQAAHSGQKDTQEKFLPQVNPSSVRKINNRRVPKEFLSHAAKEALERRQSSLRIFPDSRRQLSRESEYQRILRAKIGHHLTGQDPKFKPSEFLGWRNELVGIKEHAADTTESTSL